MFVFRYIQFFFLITALLIVNIINGQQAVIKVLDQKTKNPVPYAHVCFESVSSGEQRHSMTNDDGEVANDCQGQAIIAITFVGYETLFDTINAGESVNVQLKPAILDMDEVVVTAQYSPQKVDKSIYKIKVMGVKKIEQKAATNLTELFKDELSIRVSQDAVLGASMSIRGLSGEHVKFLIDGVPMIGRMNGNIDLGQINLNNVEHIEMIEGPMSVVYGSNALAGVVNIITKQNRNTKFEAFAETYMESVGVFNVNGSISFKKKRSVYSLAAARNFFGGYSSTNTDDRELKWKPKRQYSIDGSYLYSHNNYKLRFTSQYFDEKLWNKGNVIQPVYALDTYFYTKRFTNSLDVSTKIGGHRYFSLVAAYSMYDRIRDSYFKNLNTLENVPIDDDATRFNAITFRPVISKSREDSKLNYQFGLDFNIENGSGEKITDYKQDIGDYAGFLTMKYAPVPTFILQPGIRLIYNTKYDAPIVYNINLQWLAMENINLRASYARGFRAPSLKELYLYFVDINHNIQGNENLGAENSHNVNLSLDYRRERKKTTYGFEIDLFYNKINDLITLARVNQTLYTYINVDYFESYGFQTELQYNLYPNLTWKAGVVVTGRKNDFIDDEYEASEFVYSTDINSSLTYSLIKYSIDFSVFYKNTGKTPQFIFAEGNITEDFVQDYNIMDISVIKNFFNRQLQVSIGAKNLFNNTTLPAAGTGNGTAHSGDGSLIGWGRTFFIRAAYTFKQF